MKAQQTNPKKRRAIKYASAFSFPFLAILGVVLNASGNNALIDQGELQRIQDTLNEYEARVEVIEPVVEATRHVDLPEEVRGIYWTAVTAGSNRGNQLQDYMIETGLNAVVIDLKMDNGELAFDPHDDTLDRYVQRNPYIKDLDTVLERLAEDNIYRIARIAVMRDGAFALNHPELAMRWPGGSMWQDSIGSLWVDPAAPEVTAYAIALGLEAYARGFDEVQYDYVRFASDGNISQIRFPVYDGTKTKAETMQEFFKNVGGTMQQEGIAVSFDLFGMTYLNTHDFNIGQRLQDVYPYADFISPMVYPSHYANGHLGAPNPALIPYAVVKDSLDGGAEIMMNILLPPEATPDTTDEGGLKQAAQELLDKEIRQKTRPWLQDFDIGAVYTAARIEAQIKATRDAGASGWILWNARNVYEPANYLK